MRRIENLSMNYLTRSTDRWSSSDLYTASFNFYRDTVEDGLLIKTFRCIVIKYEKSRENYTKEGTIIKNLKSIYLSSSSFEVREEECKDITDEDFKYIKSELKSKI